MASKTLAGIKRKDLLRDKAFIDDVWVDALSGKTFDVVDPATLEKLATLPEMGAADVNRAVEAADRAFSTYRQTTARQRARWLRRWNDLILENADDLALLTTAENGKTLAEAGAEVVYGASFLEWYAGEAERTHGETIPSANLAQRIITIKQPIGVATCLVPWNLPIAMITRKVGAALAAGCTTVWKPAGETPLSSLALAILAREAGFPAGSINVITTLHRVAEVGEALCTNKLVRKLSFTGSTRIGKLLARQCSENLTKLSLELGGNSPFLVFDDADVAKAVKACLLAKFRNAGQTCVTANRILVQAGIYEAFVSTLIEKVKALKVGHGMEEGVDIGALTHERAVEKAMRHIKSAVELGGQIALGGGPLESKSGYFIQPTVIKNMSHSSITWKEETFAPVLGVFKFETEEEGIALANDCDVGLGSFICTSSIARSWRVAEALQVGMVGVNLGLLSAAENPFGGVKESGYGKEGGRQGIDEYMHQKSIFIDVTE
ncbi:Glutarate-semialdehyde dehydrogenase DavD [Fonsecaea pedrosoi]|nr:Glutarate-semialdehyde dehydrogenase DavD [Fonsecaea pedrosoi]